MKSVPTIDAHHHIWRLNDLPWLSGPQVPRIFGPYQPICRDYTIDEYRGDIAGCDIVKSIYIQTNWPAGQSYDEARWVQSVSDATGWPHANVAHADLADPDVGALIARLAKLPATRGIRQQLHWHENPQYPLCAASRCHERRRVAARAGDAGRPRPAVRIADFRQPDGRRRQAGASVSANHLRARACRHAGGHVAAGMAAAGARA